jgi:hypothetical protein
VTADNLHALYVAKANEYATVRYDLAQTLGAEKQQWFEAVAYADSEVSSVAARKEYADSRTVGLRIEALKLPGRVDGLRAFLDCLDALVRAGVTSLPDRSTDLEP